MEHQAERENYFMYLLYSILKDNEPYLKMLTIADL